MSNRIIIYGDKENKPKHKQLIQLTCPRCGSDNISLEINWLKRSDKDPAGLFWGSSHCRACGRWIDFNWDNHGKLEITD